MQSPSNLTPFARCVPVRGNEVRVVRLPLERELGFGGLDVISHVLYREQLLLRQQGLQTLVLYVSQPVDLRLLWLLRELAQCRHILLDVVVIRCDPHSVRYYEYHKSGLCSLVEARHRASCDAYCAEHTCRQKSLIANVICHARRRSSVGT